MTDLTSDSAHNQKCLVPDKDILPKYNGSFHIFGSQHRVQSLAEDYSVVDVRAMCVSVHDTWNVNSRVKFNKRRFLSELNITDIQLVMILPFLLCSAGKIVGAAVCFHAPMLCVFKHFPFYFCLF